MSPADFSFLFGRVGQLLAHGEEQVSGLGRQPGGQFVVIQSRELEQVDDLLRQLLEAVVRGQPQVGILRPLVRAVDPGEIA